MFKVYFPKQHISLDVPEGTTVFEAELMAGLQPEALCGGAGLCRKCRVEIRYENGRRENVLACRKKIQEDLTVLYPDDSASAAPSGILTEGTGLPKKASGKAQAGHQLTAALDLGTTTLVLYLADREAGELLTTLSCLNPQIRFGADVISRADYALKHSGEELSSAIREAVNDLLQEALKETGADAGDLDSVTLAGNSCMHHLFLGLSVKSLALSPYKPVMTDPLILNASDYGFRVNEKVKLYMLPLIGGFVGSDTTAVMAASDLDLKEDLTLIIDIGTNGELVLGNRDRSLACSTAAGPAFEGANITCGMRSSEGAIDHVKISGEELNYSVIGKGKPAGICGSGLLDLTAELLRTGIIDESGKFCETSFEDITSLQKRIKMTNGMKCFILAEETESATGEPIRLTQKDIREVQLAKAAIASGISILFSHFGCKVTDIKQVLIAGAFGSFMSKENAGTLGLIPPTLIPRTEIIGNAAGTGALLCALKSSCMERAEKLAARTEYVELASDPDFQDLFIDELTLGCF